MCILFAYINNDASDAEEFKLIIALNRDEFYDRPTLPANFWNDHCIGGIDAEPGKEGGTWFALSAKHQRIGALLNILQSVVPTAKCGRGHLVTEFLQGDEDAASYTKRINQCKDKYNEFNLVLLEHRDNKWSVHYCSSVDDQSPRQIPAGILAFGNSSIDRPWQKVVKGREKFEQIVKSHSSCKDVDVLKEKLLELLSDRTSCLPDVVLESQLKPDHKQYLPGRSAIHVDLTPFTPSVRYGTRTHTILLINGIGQCEFFEKTMKPSSADEIAACSPPTWQSASHSFQLG